MTRSLLLVLAILVSHVALANAGWQTVEFKDHPYRVAFRVEPTRRVAPVTDMDDKLQWEQYEQTEGNINLPQGETTFLAAVTKRSDFKEKSIHQFARDFCRRSKKSMEAMLKDNPLLKNAPLEAVVLRETPIVQYGYEGYQFTLRATLITFGLFQQQNRREVDELDCRLLQIGGTTVLLTRRQILGKFNVPAEKQFSATHPKAQAFFNSFELVGDKHPQPSKRTTDSLEGTWVIVESTGPSGDNNEDWFGNSEIKVGNEWTFTSNKLITHSGYVKLTSSRTIRKLLLMARDEPLLFGKYELQENDRVTIVHHHASQPEGSDAPESAVTVLVRVGQANLHFADPFERPIRR